MWLWFRLWFANTYMQKKKIPWGQSYHQNPPLSLDGNNSSSWERWTSGEEGVYHKSRYIFKPATPTCAQMLTQQDWVSGLRAKSPICNWLSAPAARFSPSLFWQSTWLNVQERKKKKTITALTAPQRFYSRVKNSNRRSLPWREKRRPSVRFYVQLTLYSVCVCVCD